MKLKDIKKLIPIKTDEIQVDSTAMIENYFFNNTPVTKNYKEESIEFMIQNQTNFHSTFNNIDILVKKFLKVSCPKCNCEIESKGGGGNSDFTTINFRCPQCSTEISLSFPHDGISVEFKK